MKQIQLHQFIVSILTLLWTYAALSKLTNLQETIIQMQKQLLPEWSGLFLAIALPIVELCIAIFLNIKSTRGIGLRGSAILLATFSIYIIYVLVQKKDNIPCSCGGLISRLQWRPHLYLNLLFIGLCIKGITLNNSKHTYRPSN
jgi:putative oxidoreductase